MIEIKICGRGGQGVVVAAELLAIAGFKDGKYTQAFPFFGVERRGSPVESYVRFDDKFIITRERVYDPDITIVISGSDELCKSIKKEHKILLNTKDNKIKGENIHTINLFEICKDSITENVAMLGFFAKVTGLVSLESLKFAVDEKFTGDAANKNKEILEKVYNVS